MDTKAVKKFIADELNKGTGLSDIQKLLDSELNVKMTFLDLRILASELENVEWEKEEEVHQEEIIDQEVEEDAMEDPTAGQTIVEISKLVRPGAVASGTVKFKSGASAEWILDQYGRLGLDKTVGQPDEEDLKEFQKELQRVISRGHH